MKFLVGENGRNPEKNLPRPRFVHKKKKKHGVIEGRTQNPCGSGERLTAYITRPHFHLFYFHKIKPGVGLCGTMSVNLSCLAPSASNLTLNVPPVMILKLPFYRHNIVPRLSRVHEPNPEKLPCRRKYLLDMIVRLPGPSVETT